jgi:hypothetical protein
MRENAHTIRKPTLFQNANKLKSLHFKSNTGIDDQQDQIRNFGQIHHGIDIIGTLDESDSLRFARPASNRPTYFLQFVFRVVFQQGFYYRSFSRLFGTLHHDGYRRAERGRSVLVEKGGWVGKFAFFVRFYGVFFLVFRLGF